MYSYPSNAPNPAATAGILAFAGLYSVVVLAIAVLVIAGLWKIFTKAGEPGWHAIVPILNVITLLKIAGKPAW